MNDREFMELPLDEQRELLRSDEEVALIANANDVTLTVQELNDLKPQRPSFERIGIWADDFFGGMWRGLKNWASFRNELSREVREAAHEDGLLEAREGI